jgi:hypothetical protein
MNCQRKKKKDLHIIATNNGAIEIRSVKALKLSLKNCKRQYSASMFDWITAAIIFYV